MCYISGGIPEGSSEPNEGCRDKNQPSESRAVALAFDLYFAGHSAAWGDGGAAFIRKADQESITLGRMYLITDEQFNDVVLQENSRDVDGSRFVPAFEQLTSRREFILPGNPWYGRLLNVGKEGDHSVLTFTTARADLPSNAPSEGYVKTIVSGIKETYPNMMNVEISAYLLRASGIKGNIQPSQIARWVEEAH